MQFTQIKIMLAIAPITSERWYPNDIRMEAGLLLSQIEKIEMKNPDKSLNMCAASDKMAND
jgi:hypothetical protein